MKASIRFYSPGKDRFDHVNWSVYAYLRIAYQCLRNTVFTFLHSVMRDRTTQDWCFRRLRRYLLYRVQTFTSTTLLPLSSSLRSPLSYWITWSISRPKRRIRAPMAQTDHTIICLTSLKLASLAVPIFVTFRYANMFILDCAFGDI